MRGFLDDDEEEDKPAPQPKRDTELTLGYLSVLGLFFALIVLCALCYGLGYEMGRSSAGPVMTLPPGTPTKASSAPKRTATSQNPADNAQGNSAAAGETEAQTSPPPAAPPSVAQRAAQSLLAVRTIPAPAQPRMSPALPGGPYMVQITAVSNPDDGELLVNALRKKGYQVSTRREGDGLIHVRLGPFTTREDAGHWRQKLLSDGYPATILQ